MTAIRTPRPWEIPEQLATPERVFLDRRQLLHAAGLAGLGMALAPNLACAASITGLDPERIKAPALGKRFQEKFPATRNPVYELGGRPLTPEETAGTYNNFYEFSLEKDKVWKAAHGYPVDPWTIEVAGLVEKPRRLDLDDLFTVAPLEERLYRFRCVERWAMQVPWTGYPLAKLIEALKPLGTARYVRFVSVLDKEGLPGQTKNPHYPWPYYEALRLDEARNELAFVALGSYGHAMPMQHGAPWRVVCPWKYGYKSPKSLVRIEFTAEQPPTFWNDLQPSEYGFYSNVDPGKPHPRWSQATEEDIGTFEKRPTLLYNGYQAQVAGLYDGKEV